MTTVNLKDLDFSPGAPVKSLFVPVGSIYMGNKANSFTPGKTFTPLGADR